jgi:hypothetical protein
MNLIKYNFIPDLVQPSLKNYNKVFSKYINTLKQIVTDKISQLFNISKTIIYTKFQNKKTEYVENFNITIDKLNEDINKTKKIIYEILIELNIYSFLILNTKYKTQKDIDKLNILKDNEQFNKKATDDINRELMASNI